MPHPYLHEYLLNSALPLKRNIASVYGILHQVLKELHKELSTVTNYNKDLIEARKRIIESTPDKLLNKK